eukprot:4957622-Lingulodinium_polyedra.AAC.1
MVALLTKWSNAFKISAVPRCHCALAGLAGAVLPKSLCSVQFYFEEAFEALASYLPSSVEVEAS